MGDASVGRCRWIGRYRAPAMSRSDDVLMGMAAHASSAGVHLPGGTANRTVRGQVPKRPKGTDCKSVASSFSGSNPLLPTSFEPFASMGRDRERTRFKNGRYKSGCSLMVKRQPSKLVTRVRFPSPAPEILGGSPGTGGPCRMRWLAMDSGSRPRQPVEAGCRPCRGRRSFSRTGAGWEADGPGRSLQVRGVPEGSRNKVRRTQAAVAQSVEHFLGKEEVTGSIPVSSSI
jgi:hypothetical protein